MKVGHRARLVDGSGAASRFAGGMRAAWPAGRGGSMFDI